MLSADSVGWVSIYMKKIRGHNFTIQRHECFTDWLKCLNNWLIIICNTSTLQQNHITAYRHLYQHRKLTEWYFTSFEFTVHHNSKFRISEIRINVNVGNLYYHGKLSNSKTRIKCLRWFLIQRLRLLTLPASKHINN